MSEERPQHPRSLQKAQKTPRKLPASTGPETMEKCRRMTNKDLSSIHGSPPRGPKRPRKPRGPSGPKAAASSKRSCPGPIREGRTCGRWKVHAYRGRRVPSSLLYSPECVEGLFCELLRLYGVLRSCFAGAYSPSNRGKESPEDHRPQREARGWTMYRSSFERALAGGRRGPTKRYTRRARSTRKRS
jgi:hypothetical protein